MRSKRAFIALTPCKTNQTTERRTRYCADEHPANNI